MLSKRFASQQESIFKAIEARSKERLTSLSKTLDNYKQKEVANIKSVLENLEMASWLATGKKHTKRAKELLNKLDILEQAHKQPSQLSVGQQQRVSIARALINEPKVLLADEPTSSLDDKNADNVMELLETLSKEYKAALIIVTHDNRIKAKFTNQITMV